MPANSSWWLANEFADFVDADDKCITGKYAAARASPRYSAAREKLFIQQHVPAQAASMTCLYDHGYVSLLDDWDDQSRATQKEVMHGKGFERLLPAVDPTTWKLLPRQPLRYDKQRNAARLKKANTEHPVQYA